MVLFSGNIARAADISSGSGVVIGARGEILTNAHVIENCTKITVRSSSAAAAHLVARDSKNDLAVVISNLPLSSVAVFREGGPVRPGDAVVALGYPLSGLLSTTTNLSVGNVSALAGLGDDSRYLQISAPVQPGNSGGPLLDTSGHLVGIVTGKLNAMRLAPILGDVPQNVNFALKAEVARTFLDSKGIAYQTARSEQQLSPADVGDIARPFTVLIECEEANSRPAAGPEPQPRTEVQYRASMNLNLRISPDVSSANLLGAWSPDYIPEGTMFVGQPRCILQGAGAGWCKITFKHRNGIVTIGWVNGWYLEKMP
jgi:trypsin-like peptidase